MGLKARAGGARSRQSSSPSRQAGWSPLQAAEVTIKFMFLPWSYAPCSHVSPMPFRAKWTTWSSRRRPAMRSALSTSAAEGIKAFRFARSTTARVPMTSIPRALAQVRAAASSSTAVAGLLSIATASRVGGPAGPGRKAGLRESPRLPPPGRAVPCTNRAGDEAGPPLPVR